MTEYDKIGVYVAWPVIIPVALTLLVVGSVQTVSGQAVTINLIDQNHKWIPFNDAKVSTVDGTLNITVNTTNPNEIFNRAYLWTQPSIKERPIILSLDYASRSYKGNAQFYAEIRENNTDNLNKSAFESIVPYFLSNTANQNGIVWYSNLGNTNGQFVSKTFILPNIVGEGGPVEFRMYIITHDPSQHDLRIKKALIGSSLENLLRLH